MTRPVWPGPSGSSHPVEGSWSAWATSDGTAHDPGPDRGGERSTASGVAPGRRDDGDAERVAHASDRPGRRETGEDAHGVGRTVADVEPPAAQSQGVGIGAYLDDSRHRERREAQYHDVARAGRTDIGRAPVGRDDDGAGRAAGITSLLADQVDGLADRAAGSTIGITVALTASRTYAVRPLARWRWPSATCPGVGWA